MTFRKTTKLCCMILALCAGLQAAQVAGVVADSHEAAVAGAVVRLTNRQTKLGVSLETDTSGAFAFPGLAAGQYSLHIIHPGFKAWEEPDLTLAADQSLDVGMIRLTVGDINTTVTVRAEAAHVATDTSDRSFLIGASQLENTPNLGRDWLNVLQILPGIIDLNPHDSPGWNSGTPTMNGGESGQVLISLDGVTSQDSGAPQGNGYLAPSTDAIAEVRVLSGNYAAEYGSRSGGQVIVTMRGGGNQYHGTGYYVYRHETLNANEFFNNASGISRPLYRYGNEGGTFGGPLALPGHKSDNRMFFFFSEDYLAFLTPSALSRYTMPTALERQGNFSKTYTTTLSLIPIKDPTTGKVYPGNVIPPSQISPAGYALMNLFPLPNATDPTGQNQYNALYQFSRHDPKENRVLRLDDNLTAATRLSLRLIQDYQGDRGIGAAFNGSGNWGQLPTDYGIQSAGAVVSVVHTFRPNLINEFTAGINHAHQTVGVSNQTALEANQLSALAGPNGQPVTLPKIYPGNETGLMANLIPNIRLYTLNAQAAGQGVNYAPGFTFDSRFPYTGTDQTINVTDNLTWVADKHSIKFGFLLEKVARNVNVYSLYNTNGTYYFGSDTANPHDTGYAYSNLLIGTVQAYGEDSGRSVNHARYTQLEWYVQDSWRVARRLTLDLGVRFQLPGALRSANTQLSLFNASAYNPAQSGTLLYPAVVNGQKVAENLTTKAVYPLSAAGFFDPASYAAGSSPYSGIIQYQNQAFQNPGVGIGPRIGFGWDVFGDGKTALRGGIGIYYDRAFGVDTNGATSAGVGPISAPPQFQAPTYYNTTFSLLPTTQGYLAPATVFAGSTYKNPATYSWSLGIQRSLGMGVILDIAYVANTARHRFVQVDGNGVAPYTDWTPLGGAKAAYIDPTSGGSAFYTANLLRPYAGYAAINYSCSCGDSNYNSLQAQVNRRFGRQFQMGLNWTWSKTLTYGNRSPWTPDYLQYTETGGDRPQAVTLNYTYTVPNLSRIWRTKAVKMALDGWRLNGLVRFMSGNPLTVNCIPSGQPIGYWTGTPTGGIPFRCQMLGKPLFLSGGFAVSDKTHYPLNAGNFVLPPATTLGIGNTPPTLFFGPGFENFDLSISKEFRLGPDGRKTLEMRGDAFSALNHFNPGNPNTYLVLTYPTNINSNSGFGSVSYAANQARKIALSIRLRF